MSRPPSSPLVSDLDEDEMTSSTLTSPDAMVWSLVPPSPAETEFQSQKPSSSLLDHAGSKEAVSVGKAPYNRELELHGLLTIYTDLSAILVPLALLVFVSMVVFANGRPRDQYYDGFQDVITIVSSVVHGNRNWA